MFDNLIWGGGAYILLMGMPFILLGLAVPYAVLRLRADCDADSAVGLGASLHFFYSLSVLLFLTGLTLLVSELDILGPPRFGRREMFPTPMQRTAFGLMSSGGLFGLVHFAFIMLMTQNLLRSPVRRMFVGCRFAVHGLVVLFALIMLMVTIFHIERQAGSESLQNSLSILVVWGPSWLIHLILLRRASRRPRGESWGPEPARPEYRSL